MGLKEHTTFILWKDFLDLAGLKGKLNTELQYLQTAWRSIKAWDPEQRYKIINYTQKQADSIFASSIGIFKWIKQW